MVGLSVLRSRSFLGGLACGVVVMVLGRFIVNETTLADHLVAPLLTKDSAGNADVIVALGAGIVGNCVPNLNSLRRVMLAARLFRQHRAPLLAIAGGSGDVGCPVADAMLQQALDLGIPADRIRVERRSGSTFENAQFIAPLLRAERVQRVLLVTDRLHMRRAEGAFEHHGFDVEPVSVPIYEGHENNISMLTAAIREGMALSYYRMRGWMQPGRSTKSDTAAASNAVVSGRGVSFPNGPLVILGASYAKNWNVTSIEGRPVVNVGVAGEQSFEMHARFERDVVAVRPRAVLIWGFINDLFSTGDFDKSSERVRTGFEDMIRMARAAGIEPIAATEITVRVGRGWMDSGRRFVGGLLGRKSYQEQINERVMDLNRWLRDFCRHQNILLLDLSQTLGDPSGHRRPEFATEDGSHVTPAGYDALTAYAQPILTRHLRAAAEDQTPAR